MSTKKKTSEKRSLVFQYSAAEFNDIVKTGYTRLADVPEVEIAVNFVADQISTMTIKLMENTTLGNKRIRNELSRKIDIEPCEYITRQAWIKKIVKECLLNGNSVHLPVIKAGNIDYIKPLKKSSINFSEDSNGGYTVICNGVTMQPDEVLHFAYNIDTDKPWYGRGYSISLGNVVKTLSQSRKTATALMESPVPPIIVKVDGLSADFSSKAGRDKLTEQYITSNETGKPWLIPAENFSVETLKPLNLNDLAIVDSVKLDKRTIAAIIGVPPFIVGEGDFNQDAHNHFVSTKMLPIVKMIEQELTRKILVNPKWFFELNPRSLYSYKITELAEVSCNLVDRAIMDRNEARDWISLDPREGLSELAILENYIPYAKIGDQSKLKGGDDSGNKNTK